MNKKTKKVTKVERKK